MATYGGGENASYREPENPWENGYNKSVYGNLRGECLNQEIFHSLK